MLFRLVSFSLLLLLAGCVTAEEQRAADEQKCRSYGFARRNDAFAECMQRLDMARRAAYRGPVYDGWGRPVIVERF